MIDAAEALRKIRRMASFYAAGNLKDDEMANAFLFTVMEAPLSATDECLDAVPGAARLAVLNMLTEFASREYYDERHAFIRDGRTLDQRREYYRQMQAHYRAVGEYLLARLRPAELVAPAKRRWQTGSGG